MRARNLSIPATASRVFLACASLVALHAMADIRHAPEAVLRAAYQQGDFNGVALVAEKGKVILEQAYGTVGSAPGEHLTVDHRFNIGSIAKEFSAVSIMQLRNRGKLALSDPVSRFLPDLPEWGAAVEVRHLLDYTSGVPDMSWGTITSDADAYADIRRFTALAFEPGSQYSYSYNNVMLRQFIVEKIAGMPFNDYLARRIFRPCGMKAALPAVSKETPRVARAFNASRKEDATNMPVTGVPFMTARDLLAWSQCLHRGRILDEESIRLLARGFNLENGALGKVEWRGDRLARHSHEGQSRNFEALLRTDRENARTIVLLGNSKRGKLHEIAAAIAAN